MQAAWLAMLTLKGHDMRHDKTKAQAEQAGAEWARQPGYVTPMSLQDVARRYAQGCAIRRVAFVAGAMTALTQAYVDTYASKVTKVNKG